MSPKVVPAVPFYKGSWLHPEARERFFSRFDLEGVQEWLSKIPRPWAVDLFSGAGGLSLGLKMAGFNVVAAADADAASIETHSRNLGGIGYVGDLTKPESLVQLLRKSGIEDVDLVAGGPPCQPFSRAGSSKLRDLISTGVRESDDPRTELWSSFVETVRLLKPKAVLFENVPDLSAWSDGKVLMDLMESLDGLGYQVDARILDAFRYGVPQHRARLFIVGIKRGRSFGWPEPSSTFPSLRDAIGDLPDVGPAQRQHRYPYEGPKSELQRNLRAGVSNKDEGVVWDHITRDVRSDDAEAYSILLPGQTYRDLPRRLQRYRSDIFDDKYKRLEWDQLSRTITAHIAKDGYWYIHPSEDRTLSIREAARIQTFPDWFRFAGYPSHQLRQIGNAVPPLLAHAMGNSVFQSVTEDAPRRRVSSRNAYRSALLEWHDGLLPTHRRSGDPWKVLLGELLRGSDALAVERLYSRLVESGPAPDLYVSNWKSLSLIATSVGAVSKAEKALRVATQIVERFDGEVPEGYLSLRTLPEVGERAAAAVRTFGFGHKVAIIDAGSQRVVERITGRTSLPKHQLRLELMKLAGTVGTDGAFGQAIDALAKDVCKNTLPDCSLCPLRKLCATGRVPEDRSNRQGGLLAG